MLVPLHPQHSHTQPAADDPHSDRQTAGSLFVSLAFWIALSTAATILAAAQLAPALVRWKDTLDQRNRHATELIQLENELARLERLAATIASDTEFAAAIRAGGESAAAAKTLLNLQPAKPPQPNSQQPRDTKLADTHTHAHDSDHTHDSHTTPQLPIAIPALRQIPTFQQILNQTLLPAARQLTASPQLLRQLLGLAAALTIFAFTCLNNSTAATTLALLKLPLTITATFTRRYNPRKQHFATNPPEPVADHRLPTIMHEEMRSDSSVGRATDS